MAKSSSAAMDLSCTRGSELMINAARAQPAPAAELCTELSTSDRRMHQNATGCGAQHSGADGPTALASTGAPGARPDSDLRPTAPRSKAEAVGFVLSLQQEHAIELFVAGRNDVEVSAALRVHRATVIRWRLHHVGFRAALSRRRHEVWGAAGDRVRGMLDAAVDVLQRQLADDDPSISFRAARMLLQMAGGGRFAPPDAPTDPLSLLDDHARELRRQRLADDPADQPVGYGDRVAALEDLCRRFDGHGEPGALPLPAPPTAPARRRPPRAAPGP